MTSPSDREVDQRSTLPTEEEITFFRCPPEQAKGTCEPFDDPKAHDFQGWHELDAGLWSTVCTRCGISSFAHALRYAP